MASSTLTPTRNRTPSRAMRSMRRKITDLSSFMLGMPYMRRPPRRSSRSKTVTVCPRRLSRSAAARPAGPEPTTATVLSDLAAGIRGSMSPWEKAFSMMVSSFSLMVTLWPFMPHTQAVSHSAGQTRPVNSGKLLVFNRRERAWPPFPCQVISFHSGIRLWRGQP